MIDNLFDRICKIKSARKNYLDFHGKNNLIEFANYNSFNSNDGYNNYNVIFIKS